VGQLNSAAAEITQLGFPKEDAASKLATLVEDACSRGAMMNTPLIFRSISVLVCFSAATSGLSQNLPAIPPSLDATFWGRANEPYILKLTHTSTSADGSGVLRKISQQVTVYRDSEGRVRTETFYDNGQPMAVSIRDPIKNTFTFMKVVGKTVSVMDLPRIGVPPPGKGWVAEQLPARVIDGISAEGIRFTRSIPASADGSRPADTIIEEDWLSTKLGIVLERTDKSQRTGTTTDTVSDFKQAEPDSVLFTVPGDYSPPQGDKPEQRP
jgi:hypothetical protein